MAVAWAAIAAGLSSFASKAIEVVIAAHPETFCQVYWLGDCESIQQRLDWACSTGALPGVVWEPSVIQSGCSGHF
ncbi:hypothetical protein JOF56_009964 [Kibdelosporangium banguiense]|uniref:Uncharacterized protein n=1 Tax=Kibdelosporangium banguiense TaxID=1365924 RepID=A0ABS4TYV0_9PSEU|nr:hypothetical protein [Kibdelosporangium banguiense]MBP2329579.1 hypothetical protein [Kibdelosporangium banguiense]